MKFKYNFLARKLYKLQAEYTYEVSEDDYFRYPSGIREGFLLGENERITFSFAWSFFTIYYQKAKLAYQKTLNLPVNGEIIFEFSEQDRINSS